MRLLRLRGRARLPWPRVDARWYVLLAELPECRVSITGDGACTASAAWGGAALQRGHGKQAPWKVAHRHSGRSRPGSAPARSACPCGTCPPRAGAGGPRVRAQAWRRAQQSGRQWERPAALHTGTRSRPRPHRRCPLARTRAAPAEGRQSARWHVQAHDLAPFKSSTCTPVKQHYCSTSSRNSRKMKERRPCGQHLDSTAVPSSVEHNYGCNRETHRHLGVRQEAF